MSRVISTDVPKDLAERIEEAREGGESRSACVRRLIRAGLEAEADDQSPLIVSLLLIVGSLSLGIAIEPVASPGLFVAAAIGALLLAAGVERGIL